MRSLPSAGDLIAGLSVAFVAIPQSLAYAELAGLPAQYGLYASALPSIFAAWFVSSRHLQTGPVALTALLSFGALSSVAEPFSDAWIEQAALLALLVGVMRIALGIFKMGRVAYLLSEPMLLGFTTAAAILIIASQLPKVFDVSTGDRGVLLEAAAVLARPDRWNFAAVGFALFVAAVVHIGRRLHPLFPGFLVAVVGALVGSRVLNYSGSTVDELTGGFIALRWSFPWSATGQLIVPAAAIALVGFAEPASIARTFAAEDRVIWSPDREFISQGVANVAAGFSGAFPVGGSFSRSSLNRAAGASSAWAGAITGLAVLAALPLTPALNALPTAVLGAIVVVAMVKLIRLPAIAVMVRQSGAQALVAGGTMLATLLAAPRVELGVLAGIVLSLLAHLYRELTMTADVRVEGNRLVLSPHGVLWFAIVPSLDERLREHLVAHPHVADIEIDLAAVGRLDYSGASALARLAEESRGNGIPVTFSNIPAGCKRAAGIHLIGTEPINDEVQPRSDTSV